METFSELPIAPNKASLRHDVLRSLRQNGAESLQFAGETIAAHVDRWMSERDFEATKGIGFYSSFSDEVCTRTLDKVLKKRQIRRFLPRWKNTSSFMHFVEIPATHALTDFDLRSASEVPLDEIHTILVPGLAFDAFGNRLGRGQGFYDRFLASIKRLRCPPLTIGIALDSQLLERIPVDSHDQCVDMICTPSLGIMRALG